MKRIGVGEGRDWNVSAKMLPRFDITIDDPHLVYNDVSNIWVKGMPGEDLLIPNSIKIYFSNHRSDL